MKVIFALFSLISIFSTHAQISSEFSVGALQSVGANKYQLISSSSQAAGVATGTSQRYSKAG